MRSRFRTGIALALVVVVALALVGCQQIAENAAKGAIEQATGVKVDQSSGKITVSSSGTVAVVGDKTLPEGLPSDFPVYKGTIQTGAKADAPGMTNYSFSLETPDDAKTVSEWYIGKLEDAGWKVEHTTMEAGGSTVVSMVGKLAKSEANITVAQKDGNTTIISVLSVPK